jgi:gas vesicle protein
MAEALHLILDLERLMFWNRSKTGKSYLVYAEVIEEEDKLVDVTIGIAQKINNMGEKINKKTTNSIKSSEDTIMKVMKTMQEKNKDVSETMKTEISAANKKNDDMKQELKEDINQIKE